MKIHVEYLVDRPELLPLIAGWIFEVWTREVGLTRAQTETVVRRRMNRYRTPMTLLACADERALGTVSIIHEKTPDDRQTCCLAGLYVEPAWRRRGIGTALCRRAGDEARNLGLETLCLYAADHVGFYERLGWRKTGETTYQDRVMSFMEPAALLPASLAFGQALPGIDRPRTGCQSVGWATP